MTCPVCGTMCADNAQNCPTCGQAFAPQPQQPVYQQPVYQQPVYQQPMYQQPPVRMGVPVQTNRSLIVFILLTFITFGIYGLYFIHMLAKDVNEMCKDDGEKVPGLLGYLALSIVTCGIYSYYWMYKVQDRMQRTGPRLGVQVTDSGAAVLLWAIFGSLLCGIGQYVAMYLIIKTANTVGAAYNARCCGGY